MRTRWLVVALLIWGCSDDPKAPLSSGGPGGHEIGVNPGKDANDDDDDAGGGPKGDAGVGGPMAFECARVDPVQYTDDVVPETTATSSPLDFAVTRQVATWRGDCSSPLLVIELSDGRCPDGNGHELELSIAAIAVEGGQIGFGLNELLPEPDTLGLRARYTRPKELDPAGIWGSCAAAGGQLNFYEAPDLAASTSLRASYDFELTHCDDVINPSIRVSGYFDVRVRRGLSSVCRDR